MKVGIIIQARMGSSRLPGKVMKEILGRPMLAHQLERLKTVKDVDIIVVATSTDSSDDIIEEFCIRNNTNCYRGSLLDVQSRYLEAAKLFNIETILRVTSDCPLIDPAIVSRSLNLFKRLSFSGHHYLSNVIDRTYPRGMDIEIFSIDLLALAANNSQSSYDKEHVTPYMIRNDNGSILQHTVKNDVNLSAYRFTVDYPKDFNQIKRIMEVGLKTYRLAELINVAKENKLDWHDNSEDSDLWLNQPQPQPQPQPQTLLKSIFGIGSAQFGAYYGKFNKEGVPSINSIQKILHKAIEFNIGVIDTSPLYGKSEAVLGEFENLLTKFNVVTKTPKFAGWKICKEDGDNLSASFRNSLNLMKQNSVYGLLVHDPKDLMKPNSEYLFDALLELQDKNLVKKIGISVYTGAEAEAVLERFSVDLIQLPINVLDKRLIFSGALARLAESGIEIHGRSAFLQGLLLANPDELDRNFEPVKPVLKKFRHLSERFNIPLAQLALLYLKSIPELSKIIIGIESLAQIDEIFSTLPSSLNDELILELDDLVVVDPEILNPYLWVQ